jgi:hypothetical protein
MTDAPTTSPTTAKSGMADSEAHDLEKTADGETHELEEYAGGYITARRGSIPAWLLVVYAVLFVWALYYLVTFWGGLGPGRIG